MNDKWRSDLTTVKVPTLVYEMFTILQKRYGDKRMGDAVLRFMEECDPDLAKTAYEALEIKEKLEEIYKQGDE